jgi:sugar phosphate isomerase/epimerase
MGAHHERATVTDEPHRRPGTDASDRVELALDLLAALERDELPLPAVVDRIETVTTEPTLVRTVLDEAERRGIVDRDGNRVRMRRRGSVVRFDRQVVERDGEFDCRRCGASLSTGHFVEFEAGELGPFGSSCVRTVLGRD